MRFLGEPKAVLAERGFKIRGEINVKVVENTDDTVYITLPARPRDCSPLLSDEELAAATEVCSAFHTSCGCGPTNIGPYCGTERGRPCADPSHAHLHADPAEILP